MVVHEPRQLKDMGKIREGQYIVRLNRGHWHIYRALNVKSDSQYQYGEAPGTPIFPSDHSEEAVKLMCNLNGWNYHKR